MKAWLHRHGYHRWCRVVPEFRSVEIGRDYRPQYLVTLDGQKIDATVFGGRPVYGTRMFRVHR